MIRTLEAQVVRAVARLDAAQGAPRVPRCYGHGAVWSIAEQCGLILLRLPPRMLPLEDFEVAVSTADTPRSSSRGTCRLTRSLQGFPELSDGAAGLVTSGGNFNW